ncbi:Pentatricopeptide repeat-containing protein [Vitis vinifera]|uniref:Pentatricopeptide repeat-containing protein n=1 Tax=Vitis vinifera TaxID=29760 RepID=A0A438KKK0_VITVI|nr:Pentatricopeptide repeat-containing protein [Vitis vinifera]
MARPSSSSSVISFLRQNPNSRIRNLGVVSGNQYGDVEGAHQHTQQQQHLEEIVKRVSDITRTRPRWEQTLLSDFPSFNFLDPTFLSHFVEHQKNALISLRFFHWLSSQSGVSPDSSSCNVLFDALVEAGGLVEEAISVFGQLKGIGVCASIATWNSVLRGSVRAGRIDFVWELILDGHNLLRRVLEDGVVPRNAAFNKLISGFCKDKAYGRVSDLLHSMIARNRAPDIFTYQEVVNGLCKGGKGPEGFRVFKDLKDRGYAPDRVMYTTMIHGLCRMKWLGDARKLWFEMIQKGFLPNEYTYNAMIHGYFKIGNLEEAWKMYREMCDKGYGEKTGILQGRKIVEGANLLYELLDQGIQPSAASYAPLIDKLCQEGDMQNAKILWDDMQNRGMEPAVCTHDFMITGFCKQGCAMEGWNG